MKKFLLCLVACLWLIPNALANTQTVTWADVYAHVGSGANEVLSGSTKVVGDVTFAFDKGSGSNDVAYYNNGSQVRMYANNTVTISVPEGNVMTSIVITATTSQPASNFTASVGSISGTDVGTWTGSASSVTFKVSSGQVRMSKVEVTYGEGTGGGTTDPDPGPGTDPTPNPGGEGGTATFNFLSPADVTAMNASVAIPTTVSTGTEVDDVIFLSNGVTVSSTKGTNNSSMLWKQTGGDLQYRIYKGSVMTISAPGTITSIVFTTGNNYFTSSYVTPSTGTLTNNNTKENSWTGSASEVTFTVGTAQNQQINTIVVTYESGDAPVVLTPQISCTDNKVSITCATQGADIYYTTDGTNPSNTSTKYTQPFEISETVTVKAIAYLNGQASSIATYTANYVGAYSGFEAFMAGGNGTEGTVSGPITAVYQSGQYFYVVDSKNYPMLVYGNVSQTFSNGDKIASVSGKYSPYSGLPELTNPTFGAVTAGGTPVAPLVIPVSEAKTTTINTYVQFDNVSIDASKNMTDDSGTIALYYRFDGVNAPEDFSKKYDVQGFISIYNGTYQIYPSSITEAAGNLDKVATPVFSVASGAVAENTQVEITCATEGAKIYYTTDGNAPTAQSTLYNGAITITEAVTIKAIAVKDGMTDSAVATASYTVINPNQKSVTFDFTQPSTLGDYSDEGEANAEVDLTGVTFTAGVISLTSYAEEGASNKPRLFYGSGNSAGWTYRFYNQNSFTISAQEGYQITAVEIEGTNMGSNITCSTGSLNGSGSNWTWAPANAQDEVTSVTVAKTATGNNPALKSITVSYDITTGIQSVEADSEAIYFNLQGQRVANPDRGIFIRVQGGKAVKIIK